MAAGNRSLCQWKRQQVVGREQMWSDHKESSRLHNSKGMFKVDFQTEFEGIEFELCSGESCNDHNHLLLLKCALEYFEMTIF